MSASISSGYLELTQTDLWPAPGQSPTERVDDLLSLIRKLQHANLEFLVVVHDAEHLLGRCTGRRAASRHDQQIRRAIADRLYHWWDGGQHYWLVFRPLTRLLLSMQALGGGDMDFPVRRFHSSNANFRVACCQPSTLILSAAKVRTRH